MAGKYTPLENYLRDLPESQREVALRFEEIERILNDKPGDSRHLRPDGGLPSRTDVLAARTVKPPRALPSSAYEDRRWWDHEKEGAPSACYRRHLPQIRHENLNVDKAHVCRIWGRMGGGMVKCWLEG